MPLPQMSVAEEELIRSFSKSQLWGWFKAYLESRREVLFSTNAKSTEELWKIHGGVHEVNRLLRAPELVLQFYEQQRLQKQEDVANGEGAPEKYIPAGRFSEGTEDF